MRKIFSIALIAALAAVSVIVGLYLAGGTRRVAADPPAVHAQAAPPSGQKAVTVAPQGLMEPVWITKVTVGDKSLVPFPNPKVRLSANQNVFGKTFEAGSDWLQNMVIYLINRTDKTIAYLDLSVDFPQTGNGTTQPVWNYSLQLGRMPAVDAINGITGKPLPIPPDAKPLGFRPGQTLAIHIGDYMGQIKTYLKTSALPFADISECYLYMLTVRFNDGLTWSAGAYGVPDKVHPGRLKYLPSGYFPGNMHHYVWWK